MEKDELSIVAANVIEVKQVSCWCAVSQFRGYGA